MTGNKTFFRQRNSFYLLVAALLGLIGYLVVEVQKNSWTGGSKIFCLFYAGVITVFFLAQLFAFVIGHANYSEAVEQPKFDMIDGESSEWERLDAKRF